VLSTFVVFLNRKDTNQFLMQSSAKTVLLTLSIMGIAMTFVLGQVVPVLAQTVPTSSNLVKRDYSYTDDQHLTAA
ncbi:hypothetical protein, partial [Nitrosococcus oceani]|uniref:hypothetical protein n=1 Tax=Nitrosococcus oceani TaxID=1229 RepID=UPI001E44B7BD